MTELVASNATPGDAQPDFLPARMLNEHAYCPRLAYLEWVQAEFADNRFTEDGRYVHRRVDKEEGELPDPAADDDAPKVVRSVLLSSEAEGLIAKVDLVEVEGARAVPVDYKRGKRPDVEGGVYEPERVQLCAQGLILRDNGFEVDGGVIYFAGSKQRVPVTFDEALVARTRELAAELRRVASSGEIPPPLEESPKCLGCSLVGICLPDETNALAEPASEARTEPRRLIPARDDALPLYVQEQGAYVGKSGEVLTIKLKGTKVAEARLFETSQVVVMGSVQVTTQAIQELCRLGTPLCYLSTGGWFYGMTLGGMHKNVELRLHQLRAADDPERALSLAKRFVSTKVLNGRTLLRRNADGLDDGVLQRLKELADQALGAESAGSLLGIEGLAARVYFEAFPLMLKKRGVDQGFTFEGRNRRPPKDPVNAMLSLAYSLLVKDLVVTLTAAGFDPYLGFYHRPRYGRPSLALDLMEEFRPLVADSTVIAAINNGVVGERDFERSHRGVALKPGARKAFILAYERRMDQLVRHPVFGYQISYRRVLDVQARLLGRHLSGELAEYPEFRTR